MQHLQLLKILLRKFVCKTTYTQQEPCKKLSVTNHHSQVADRQVNITS